MVQVTLHDIVFLDKKIKKTLLDDKKDLKKYNIRLTSMKDQLSDSLLRYNEKKQLMSGISELENKIIDISNDIPYSMYLSRTYALIEEYTKLLDTAVQTTFTSTNTTEHHNRTLRKDKLINDYINIAQDYIDIDLVYINNPVSELKICTNCKNTDCIELIDNICVCRECGKENILISTQSSFKDTDRVSFTRKYKYDRITHFRDIIMKYQAKQSNNIPPKLFLDIKNELTQHGLMTADVSSGRKTPHGSKKLKYSKVTRRHIYMFLKELRYNDYYDDCTLIYCTITGDTPPNLGGIETKLLQDFKTLITTYKKVSDQDVKMKRKNFLNSQYVLFQLLRKYKYNCRKEEFNIIKTRDRRIEHDEIYSKMCKHLMWSFTPTV